MHPPTIATSKDLINWKRLTSFKPNPDSFWFSAVLVDAGDYYFMYCTNRYLYVSPK